jgi:hypothetical protein
MVSVQYWTTAQTGQRCENHSAEFASASLATFFSRSFNTAQQYRRPADYHKDLKKLLDGSCSEGLLGKGREICDHLRETSMWREDDFEDKGKQIKVVPKDKATELINDPEPEGKVEPSDGRAHALSH